MEMLARVDGYGWTVVAVGVAGFYLVRPFVLWPLSVASVFLGYLTGFPLAVPLVLLGTVVTCLPPFLLADSFQEVNGYVTRLSRASESLVSSTGEGRAVVAARLSPAPADGVSVAAGLAGVSTRNFVVGTLVGETPWAILYVAVGDSLRSVSAVSDSTVDVEFLLVVSGCALLLVARPLYRVLVTYDRS